MEDRQNYFSLNAILFHTQNVEYNYVLIIAQNKNFRLIHKTHHSNSSEDLSTRSEKAAC